MATYALKTNDTFPPFIAVLSDLKGVINLTGAEHVEFFMKTETHELKGLCTVLSATGGEVQYEWKAGDTAIAGTYQVEFKITWTTGKTVQSVPNEGYGALVIQITV
jgi:hypothetical protein